MGTQSALLRGHHFKKTYSTAPMFLRCFKHALPFSFFIRLAATNGSSRLVINIQKIIQIASPTLARNICIIRGRDKADRSRGAAVQIAGIIGALLDLICREMCFVVNDGVVRHLDSSLETGVSLEIKVEIKANGMVNSRVQADKCNLHSSYAPVNDGSRWRISVLVSILFIGCECSCSRSATANVRSITNSLCMVAFAL